MGQSVAERPRSRKIASRTGSVEFSVFESPCGWMSLIGWDDTVHQLRLGYANPMDLRRDLQSSIRAEQLARESDWNPELREKLLAYAAGAKVSFAGVRCQWPDRTEFQRQVIQYVRKIPHGRVVSYGEVAAAVGFPGAARAVGTVMSSNRIPIIIPCHRVVAAGGKLGGYSAPRGIELKQWLLNLEQSR